jgi:hypothetical protein
MRVGWRWKEGVAGAIVNGGFVAKAGGRPVTQTVPGVFIGSVAERTQAVDPINKIKRSNGMRERWKNMAGF